MEKADFGKDKHRQVRVGRGKDRSERVRNERGKLHTKEERICWESAEGHRKDGCRRRPLELGRVYGCVWRR